MLMMWTMFLRHGSSKSHLVLTVQKIFHKRLSSCVQFSGQHEFLKTRLANSLLSPPQNCRLVSSTSIDDSVNPPNNTLIDDSAPVEWIAEEDEFTLVLSDEEIQTLSGGDPEIIKKIRYIQLEHEVYKQMGFMVVENRIKLKHWTELINLHSKAQRTKFYQYLFKFEKAIEKEKIKKQLEKEERLKRYAEAPPLPPLGEDPDGTIYGLHRNCLFIRLSDTRVGGFLNQRLVQEMQFGQPFILDCDYGRYMTLREAKNCARQLEFIFTENRSHRHPFNLYMCNAHPDDDAMKFLHTRVPPLYDPEFPMNIESKSYLDLFPREKLVYLTPHTNDILTKFDEDDIYILGCKVDQTDKRPLSALKAKKEGIRMKKLPLDHYLEWGLGNKCLTLNQIVQIMLDQRLYSDWNKAFSSVPKRKLKGHQGKDIYRQFPRENRTEYERQEEEEEEEHLSDRNAKTGFTRSEFRGEVPENPRWRQRNDAYLPNNNNRYENSWRNKAHENFPQRSYENRRHNRINDNYSSTSSENNYNNIENQNFRSQNNRQDTPRNVNLRNIFNKDK